ncbi:RfeD protein [Hirsutella rhossiliensis]|uniref:RfeD protein n=1 Tax=Hirsutella rhossiliensis TaxID=111463 RepID=A0A9P8MY72_9HYPO|nr:RfeD protein [Hirsutella rhossiliensis]KAH0963384.1 RfeD protein [Hirsutella rhossiliensis]
MPPRSSLTSSFSITDSNNEVVCPLRNQDGSSCRKRCIGEKRYRSMQEHIRRAHPENYISKLPATEESFLLMINTPPQDRRSTDQPSSSAAQNLYDRRNHLRDGSSNPGTPRHADEYPLTNGISLLGAASAAAALAELHGVKSERENETDRDYYSDTDGRRVARTSIELPPLNLSHKDVTSDPYSAGRPREILPPLLANSPPGRSSTLPPLQRPLGPNRPRKQSVTKRGRESNHKKKTSRGSAADWLRRIQNDERLRPGGSHDRKALSAEPSADYGKRWEDLIDAADQAASAAGDIDDDRTPVPQSPVSVHRGSLPPLQHQQHVQAGSYQASPLQQALTPPSYNQDSADPFPSVESGENFHMAPRGLNDSSPTYPSAHNIQIYCAACQGVSQLKGSYACTECICGLCPACVEVLMAEHGARRKCPRCATIGGRFKPFQLDVR